MTERTRIRKISVQNFKGGVGKTATVLNLGACFADKGYKVLMIDCDTQGDLTEVCGIRLEKRQPTLYHVLIEDLNVMEVVVPLRPNVHILPSDKKLAAAEALLVGMTARETTLSLRLGHLAEFDIVLLDCAPALNLMHQNALLFADELLIPVDMDKLAISGCRAILESVNTLGVYNNFRIPELTGIIPTFVDQRTNITNQVLGVLETLYPGKVLPSIRSDTKLKQAAAASQSIFEFDPKAKSANDYRVVTETLIQMKEGFRDEEATAVSQ
ncbi:MAG: AAA family ATPase [Blastocatellia bacterium]|nr:AAA family ATPase [Blastocatellia bacterium]